MEFIAYVLPVMGVVCLGSFAAVVVAAGAGALKMFIRALRRKED